MLYKQHQTIFQSVTRLCPTNSFPRHAATVPSASLLQRPPPISQRLVPGSPPRKSPPQSSCESSTRGIGKEPPHALLDAGESLRQHAFPDSLRPTSAPNANAHTHARTDAGRHTDVYACFPAPRILHAACAWRSLYVGFAKIEVGKGYICT